MAFRRMLASENVGEGTAALLSGIPVMEERGHAGKPAVHVDVSASGDRDDGVRVGLGDCLNQLVLSKGQLIATVIAFAFIRRVESDGDNDSIG
jgi:hypothetical protein